MNRKKIQHFFQIGLQVLESAIWKEKKLLSLCCLLGLALGQVVQAQGVDSLLYAKGLAIYTSAIEDYTARNWPAAYMKAGQAAQVALLARDTAKACAAMELQSNSCPGKDSLALAILDSAVRLYEAGPGDTSFVYFRLQLGRLRYLRSNERYGEAAIQADLISTLQEHIIAKDPKRGFDATFLFMMQRAEICKDLGNLSKGIYELESALTFDRDNPGCISLLAVAEAHSTLSQLYRRTANLPLAQEHFAIARTIVSEVPERTGFVAYTLIRLNTDHAALISEARRYEEATQMLYAVLSDADRQNLVDESLEIAIYNNLGNIYMKAGQIDSAWIFVMKAKEIVTQSGQAGSMLAKMEINLAAIHNKRQDYPAAILNARSAAGRITRHDASSLDDRAKAWLEAGRAFLGLGLQDSVAICLHRLQAAQLSAETLSSTLCPSAWRSASEMHLLLANFDSAEVCLRRGMQACFAQALWQGNPARVDFERLLVESTYLALLKELGHVKEKRYQLTGCIADLGDAFRHYYRATRLLAYLDARRQDLGMATLAHERLWRDNVAIVEGAIRTAHQLHRRSHHPIFVAIALACADMSKARQQGKRSIASDDALAQQIDPTLHAREKALARALETDRRIAGSAKTEGDTAALAARLRVAKHKLDWEELMKEMRIKAPRYYSLKYQDHAHWGRVLNACFAHAPAGHANLEYFVGVDSLYGFLQTAEGLQMANLGPVQPLATQVQAHQSAILTQQNIAPIAAMGKSLSRALMPFALPRQAVQRLTIVPDGFLHGVRFHSLVWHGALPASSGAHIPYWVYGPAMGVGFSLALQEAAEEAVVAAPPIDRVEGYFPQVEDTAAGLPKLGRNPAMEELAGQMLVEEKAGPAASKAAFLASFARHSIKEVKTHGRMDGDEVSDPCLLMADSTGRVDRLYASELFGVHDFNPSLVVLNACVTAKGDYLPGEGVISLVQAFAKTGIASLIANAWEAAEVGNDAVLTHFYAGAAQGLSGAEALRRARIAMLSDDDGQRRHPYTWACLEYYGAGDQPLVVPKAPRWPWVLVACALMGIWFVWWRRRSARTPTSQR